MIRRKRLGMMMLGLLLAVTSAAGALLWALTRVPDFYEDAISVNLDPAVRRQNAEEFVAHTVRLVEDIKYEPVWSEEFTQDQINSWVVEELHQKYSRHVPGGVTEPRVQFADGLVLVGFRYQEKGFNGIVSLRLRPWVAEPNQLSLEIESIQAGLVPVPVEKVADDVTRQVKRAGWRIEWTQSENGNDVAVLHLDRLKLKQAILEAVEVTGGSIRLSGKGEAKQRPLDVYR